MTTKTVTNAVGIMDGFNRASVSSVGSTTSISDSFSSVMQKTTGQNLDSMTLQLKEQPKGGVSDNAVRKENTKVAQKLEKSAKSAQNDESMKKAQDAVEEAAKKAVKEVAETLGVSEEEVVAAMETLGLSVLDLLDKANLTQLMMNLSGETDVFALTTNEALYADITEVLGSIQDELAAIGSELGLSEEQLKSSIEELLLKQKENQQILAETQEELTDGNPVFDVRGKEDEVNAMQGGQEKAVVTMMKNGEEIKAVVETDANTNAVTVTQESNPLTEQSENNGMAQNESGRHSEHGSKDSTQTPNLVLQNIMQDQNAAQVQGSSEIPLMDTQVQDIMDQIMDYMKVQVKADTSSLEMQLHPESLGTLNIHITAKDGILTAQFTTQNEMVKSAIESQLITLQENLNEQGIKVEAVEVNVAAQQFDRNMDQGQSRGGNTSEEAKKKNIRRINLGDLEPAGEEELEEADKIAVDMMARNGNTVDYLA